MDTNISIVGAGVIGLAIASELSGKYKDIYIIEKCAKFGQETSSRNSEVIHSGIYYPKNSLKAICCVEGKSLLYNLCKRENIPFNNCGKLVVATCKEDTPGLEALRQKGINNGVTDTYYVEGDELRMLEPNVKAIKALFSPSTGIIDTHSFMKHLEGNSKKNGAEYVYNVMVTGIRKIKGGYEITIKDADGMNYSFTSAIIINSAGLESANIAKSAGINDDEYHIYFCKGEYFRVKSSKNKLIKRLVYPVPNPISLGIHACLDLSGGLKLGPSAFYLDQNKYDYSVDKNNQQAFYDAAVKFLPFLEYDDLSPDMAGIRPKTQKQGDPVKDFIIREESNRGYPGFFNLLGMESPGLTSSLSIARHVLSLVEKYLQ